MKKTKAKKTKKFIMILLVTVIMVALAVLLCLYFKFVHKESNIVLLKQENSVQEIYILGTVHEYHFNRLLGYSIVDIKNAIDNIKPDLVLLEVDQNTIDKYGIIKSPIEMIPLWCYAKEREIAVKGVDWFEVTEESRSWTTDKNRDDHIFDNINASIGDEPKILIILGSRHRIEQMERFEDVGYQIVPISNISSVFTGESIDEFVYPANTGKEIEKQTEYWKTVAIDELMQVTTYESAGRRYWLDYYEKLTLSVQRILDVISKNKVFKS